MTPENDMLQKINAKLEEEQREVGGCTPGSASQSCQPPQAMISKADIHKSATSQQDGDAWLYHQLFKDLVLYDYAAGRWYIWQGHYWDLDKVDAAMRMLDAVIDLYAKEASEWAWKALEASQKGEMKDAINAEKREKEYLKKISLLQRRRWKEDVLKLAAVGVHSLGVPGDVWDTDPYLLPCINGVIELKTATFRPGRQSDFIKTVCPTQWKGLDAPCPTWKRFLSDTFDADKELVSFLHRLLGYSSTGVTIDHILPIFYGQGRNGKTTLFDSLHHTLGPLVGPIQTEMLLDQGRFRSSASPSSDIMALRGRRIAWGSETDEGRKLNIGKVKWLVGGDTLCGREPYGKREVYFKPTHTLFLQTNHKPKVDPNDYALWQRIHLIPFTLSFIDNPTRPNERPRDPHLSEKLKAEASGILAWLVEGYLEWQEHGLQPPESVRDATARYQESEDILGHFMDDCCITGPGKQVSAGDFYKAYSTWCDENGHKTLSGTKFGERMKERFEWKKTRTYIFYYGIGLTDRPF